jgi:asparagine synthase (glutamine-hydrolysing)
MYSYVAFIWDALDDSGRQTAARLSELLRHSGRGWCSLLELEGIAVFARPQDTRAMTAYVLAENSGIVLGRLFPSLRAGTPVSGHPRISPQQALSYRENGGRLFARDYWGTYVAMLRAPDGRRSWVIRDPSGHIPCYVTPYEHLNIFFADVEDLSELGLPSFTVDWTEIAAFIRWESTQSNRCGLKEVQELLAGECWELGRGSTRLFALWDPVQISEGRLRENRHEAMAELRETCESCITAWSSAFTAILLSLSGGFDSAVVLGCLRGPARSRTVICVNDLYSDPRSDERRYARIAARSAQVRLIERTVDAQDHLLSDRLFGLPRTPKPALQYVATALRADSSNELSRKIKADSLWTGEGGDHLFFQFDTVLAASDYIATHGIGRRLLRVIADTATLTRKSFATVARESWASRRRVRYLASEAERLAADHFLTPDRLSEGRSRELAAPQALERLPQGKQMQILYLRDVMNRHRPLLGVDSIPQLNPLLSQPIVELCLQIPVYCLTQGGRRRGLARDAFKAVVPQEIIARETKGSAGLFVMDILRGSHDFLHEHLLGGLLMQQGVLARPAVEQILTHLDRLCIADCRPLLACLSAEMWARTWAMRGMRLAG